MIEWNWPLINFWMNLGTLGGVPIGLAVWRSLKRTRENELRHIDAGIKDVKVVLQTEMAELKKLVLNHLVWHSTQRE